MAVYEYNISSVNEYLEDSCGLLSDSPDEVLDCGSITSCSETVDNYSSITVTETLTPFGTVKLSKKTVRAKTKRVSIYAIRLEELTKKSVILNGLQITWFGYGTFFEINNGLERLVVPDKSGGGI
jgi:hypothetical protein